MPTFRNDTKRKSRTFKLVRPHPTVRASVRVLQAVSLFEYVSRSTHDISNTRVDVFTSLSFMNKLLAVFFVSIFLKLCNFRVKYMDTIIIHKRLQTLTEDKVFIQS